MCVDRRAAQSRCRLFFGSPCHACVSAPSSDSGGPVAEERDGGGLYEGYEVTLVVGQRPLEVQEICLLVLYGPRLRCRRLHIRGRATPDLPKYLADGQQVTTSFELTGLYRPAMGRDRRRRAHAQHRSRLCRRQGHEYRRRVSRGPLEDQLRAALESSNANSLSATSRIGEGR